jgi:LysM repeat protein
MWLDEKPGKRLTHVEGNGLTLQGPESRYRYDDQTVEKLPDLKGELAKQRWYVGALEKWRAELHEKLPWAADSGIGVAAGPVAEGARDTVLPGGARGAILAGGGSLLAVGTGVAAAVGENDESGSDESPELEVQSQPQPSQSQSSQPQPSQSSQPSQPQPSQSQSAQPSQPQSQPQPSQSSQPQSQPSQPADPAPTPWSNDQYTVRPGDTLAAIAAEYTVDWELIYSANRTVIGNNPDLIRPGETLTIPKSQGSTPYIGEK